MDLFLSAETSIFQMGPTEQKHKPEDEREIQIWNAVFEELKATDTVQSSYVCGWETDSGHINPSIFCNYKHTHYVYMPDSLYSSGSRDVQCYSAVFVQYY
jgi:hypothetical protein